MKKLEEETKETCPYVSECFMCACCRNEYMRPYYCEDVEDFENCEKYHIFKKHQEKK